MIESNKTIKTYICQKCDVNYPKWQGKCSNCHNWNSIEEEINIKSPSNNNKTLSITLNLVEENQNKIVENINDISSTTSLRNQTNIIELDRVLGGGIVPGSLILIGGEPGIGKSTLVLQLALKIKNKKILYASGEESKQQIKLRAERLVEYHSGIAGKNFENFFLCNENNILNLIQNIKEIKPKIIIIDSIQTMYLPNCESIPGSISQIKYCTNYLLDIAKKTNIPIIMISHITKDGIIAGPKVLEHMVDTVLYFEGERYSSYRILRTIKNRFGSCNEIGLFEMKNDGLKEITNPSEILLSNPDINISGSAIGTFIEGNRALLIETQSLASKAIFGNPQRMATGFDIKRLNMLIAVLEKRANLNIKEKDIFLNIAGGIKIKDPAIDLSICMAIYSSIVNKPIPKKSCFIAEIGLGGEMRPVIKVEKRISEAANIGFKTIYIANQNMKNIKKDQYKKINLIPIKEITELIK